MHYFRQKCYLCSDNIELTYFVITMNQNNAKVCRLQSPTTLHCDIVSLANVVNVDWNTCISSCHTKENNTSILNKKFSSDYSFLTSLVLCQIIVLLRLLKIQILFYC